MARDDNSFALLGDNEGDDISTFLAHVALKAEASSATAEKKKKNEQSHHSHSPPSKPLPPPQSVRTESREEQEAKVMVQGGLVGMMCSSLRRAMQIKEWWSGRWVSAKHWNADGYQGSYGGDTAGNTDDGNWQGWVHKGTRARGRGRGHGGARGRGFGQGRALNEGNGFEKESQFVEGNQQLENKDHGGGTGDGWEHVTEDHSSYGGERRDNDGGGGGYKTWGDSFFGVHNGNNYEVMNTSGAKEALSSNGGDDDSGIVAETTEVSKDAFQDAAHDSSGKKAEDEEAKEAMRTQEALEKEAKRKAWEEEKKEEAKKMTLEQYQKVLLEKRKALEALKTEERKVTLDKDFESMQVVGKKAEDSKQDSEKDKLKKKDEKVRKQSMSINVFLKPAEGEVEKYDRRDRRGRGSGGYNRGSSNWQAADPANRDAQQDGFQKPAKGEDYVGNVDRRGGGRGGGYNRGSPA
ncbi:hypothetical protein HYC85_006377 [Camellia sinensis]|uniref:STM1-like N-terminal domain-containing protein n=1 Tax=Camellia sinensis TaxID=4442 RepID=A0A7J7HMQ9_CAMSI|nr:hypothetical protein HYC85_006377 [Camellia sinensis]